ncbi:hypothetical protein Leryth_017270 [Lithospermum erythrorhizon]|nr:hypothetical protein Leryth_017270 [Lithospermum erythrorhizon]
MAIKLQSLKSSRKMYTWVTFTSYFSSFSAANIIQETPETYQIFKESIFIYDFESKIQFLKNKLHPERLNQVLDSTPDVNSSLELFKWASLQKKFKHNADTYYRIILKLGMSGNIDVMEGYCNEMVKEKCTGFGEALIGSLNCFVESCRVDAAFRVLSCVNPTSFKPNIGVLNGLMGAVVEEKRDFKDVLFVYKEMIKAGIVPNVDTVNCILKSLFQAGRDDTALDHYRRMYKKGCDPNSMTFEIVVNGLIDCDRVDESLVVLDEMIKAGCPQGLKFYTRIIPLFCGMNKLEVVMRLVRAMRASQISPDSLTYEVMIRSLCKNDQLCDAINLLDGMLDDDLMPDDDVLMDIVNGFLSLNQLYEAKQFLDDREIIKTCTHNALIGRFCIVGKFHVAKDMFNELLSRNVTDRMTWSILIRYVCENANMKKGMELLCRMIVSSFAPDSSTFSALILGKCKLGEIKDALMFYHQVVAHAWVIDSVSYAEFVTSLCQNKKFQQAADLFNYMSTKECPLQSSSFDTLVNGICETKNVDSAVKLFSLALYSGARWSSVSCKSILRGLGNIGHSKGVLIMLSRLVVDGCSLDGEIYGICLRAMVELCHVRDCALIFNMMLNEHILPDSKTLSLLFSLFSELHQLHTIFSPVDKHIFNCEIVDSATYNMLITGLWKEGYTSTASRLLDKMLEEGWVPDASTHALLMGYHQNEDPNFLQSSSRSTIVPDQVSSILMEGLGDE